MRRVKNKIKIKIFTLNQLSKQLQHWLKIRELEKKYISLKKQPSTFKRLGWILVATLVVIGLMFIFGLIEFSGFIPSFTKKFNDTQGLIHLSNLIITAPILLVVWAFRDANRLHELDNARKDTNLKEFQQLQEWATGKTNGNTALQISALHSLRGYLQGKYGEDFRRGAFEIYASALQTEHQKILANIELPQHNMIKNKIQKNELCKQLNRIVEEDWFHFLINHNFPTATLSLVGVDLSDKYLRHKKYNENLDLSNTNLQGINLKDSNLQGANLQEAQLQGACFLFAQLQGAQLQKAHLQGAQLEETQLQGAQLQKAHLQGVDLSWAQLQRAQLQETQLQGAQLQDVQLQGAQLQETQLQGAQLRDVQLQGAYLGSAQLQGAVLYNAQLQGANLLCAQLQGAYLSNAQLQGAYLNNAELQGVNTSNDFALLSFEERIKQQITKKTAVEDLQNQYEGLTKEQKEAIISQLDSNKDRVAIKCIQNAPDELDLSKAETGKYSKEEAEKWIKEFNENK